MNLRKTVFLFFFAISQNIYSQNATSTSDASASEPSYYKWGLLLGYGIHAGVTDQSLASLPVYFGKISYSKESGFLRPGVNVALNSINGNFSFLETQTEFKMVNLGVGAELLLYFLSEGRIAPFIGGEGFIQRGSLLLSSAPTGYTSFSRPNVWGYELAAGFDLQTNKKTTFRLRMSFSNDTLKVGQLSPVYSTSFRIAIGF